MSTVNITDIIDALENGRACFATLDDVSVGNRISFFSERNAVVVRIVRHGKRELLRVMLAENALPENHRFIASLSDLYPDAPVMRMKLREKELTVCNAYHARVCLDVIEIDDTAEPPAAATAAGFLKTAAWFVRHNLVVHNFGFDCCSCDGSEIKVSFVGNIEIIPRSREEEMAAFKNFVLRMTVKMLLDRIDDEKFNHNRPETYLSDTYRETLFREIGETETISGQQLPAFRELVACDRIRKTIGLFYTAIDEIGRPETLPDKPYFGDPRYRVDRECCEDRLAVKDTASGLWGYVTFDGEPAVPFEYDYAGDFFEGLAVVGHNSRYGAIDREGNVVVEPVYSELSWETEFNIFIFKYRSKYGLLDRSGNPIVQTDYDFIDNFSDGCAIVRKSGLYGAINPRGEEVVPCRYERLERFQDMRTTARKGTEEVVLDIFGDVIG